MNISKEKIDIVYSWVDGSDEEWQKKKNYWAKQESVERDAINDCRFTNNDELKYSLRSLEKYANWINKIYIVTDNQVPKWLNTDNPRIQIVDHTEIIPKEYLPTFNSIIIEHCIMNIPGLSEYFLYANDDMFFLNKVSPLFFFNKSGFPIIRLRNPYDNFINLYKKSLFNADDLVKNSFNFEIKRYPCHNIDAYKKSDVIDCKNMFINDLLPTFSNKFRTDNDIQRKIYSNYALAVKHGKCRIIKQPLPTYNFYKYIPLLRKAIRYYNKFFTQETIFMLSHSTNYDILCEKNNIKLFCINDDEQSTNKDRIETKEFLNKLFPNKSEFEL